MSAATSKPISVRGIAKTYSTQSGELVSALKPITLEVGSGEFLVLVGPSGCGKSTLLSILAGFGEASAGEAFVSGERISGPDIDRGMVFESYALFPWRDVLGNVEFGLEQKGIPRRERREIALKYLQMVGLKSFANKEVDELSGGMKQRVAIARAFATEPSIIFMDEPFGALDALTRRFLQHELLRLWQEHRKTVVFVTHSVPEAVYLGDRVVVMTTRPGEIKTIFKVELPHPRDTTSDAFRDLEREFIYTPMTNSLEAWRQKDGILSSRQPRNGQGDSRLDW